VSDPLHTPRFRRPCHDGRPWTVQRGCRRGIPSPSTSSAGGLGVGISRS